MILAMAIWIVALITRSIIAKICLIMSAGLGFGLLLAGGGTLALHVMFGSLAGITFCLIEGAIPDDDDDDDDDEWAEIL